MNKTFVGKLLLMVAVLTAASAAQANMLDGESRKEATPVADPALGDITDELAIYGQFIVDASAIVQPVLDQNFRIPAEWQAATAANSIAAMNARFSPVIARSHAIVAEARTRLEALPTPEIRRLPIAQEEQPAALKAQLLTLLDNFDGMYDAYGAMIAALRNSDQSAADAAGRQLFRAARVTYEAQRIFLVAGRATAEAGSADSHALELEILFHDFGIRLIDAGARLMARQTEAALVADLEQIVISMEHEIDATIAAARAAKTEDESAAASRLPDEAARIVAAANRVDAITTRSMGVWRAFVGDIRARSGDLPRVLSHFEDLLPLTRLLGPYRQQLDAMSVEQAALLAELR